MIFCVVSKVAESWSVFEIFTTKKGKTLPRQWYRDIQHNDTKYNDTEHNYTQNYDVQRSDTEHNYTHYNDTQFMTLTIMDLIVALSKNDTQHNDTYRKDMLSVVMLRLWHFLIVMLSDVMLSVVVPRQV